MLRNSPGEPTASQYVSTVKSIDLLEMLEGRYTPQRFNGTWVTGMLLCESAILFFLILIVKKLFYLNRL